MSQFAFLHGNCDFIVSSLPPLITSDDDGNEDDDHDICWRPPEIKNRQTGPETGSKPLQKRCRSGPQSIGKLPQLSSTEADIVF